MSDFQKKDIHNRKALFQNALLKLERDNNIIPENRQLILQFIRDCRLGKTVKKRQRKVIGEARCLKYIYSLRKISSWLNSPFDQVTKEDMENLIERLDNDQYLGKIQGKNGKVIRVKKLTQSTKAGYKKIICKFYKWLLGNNDHYPELVDWIDTYETEIESP